MSLIILCQSVIRDLWALRLQKLVPKIHDPSDEDSQATVYSSMSEGSASGQDSDQSRKSQKWTTRVLPSLLDTLGLCYLGTLLLRLPVSIGDFYR